MYKVLLIVALLGLFWYMVRLTIGVSRHSGGWLSEKNDFPNGNQMVQDPVCRVFVPRGNAVREEIGGQAYFFCSQDCAKLFQKQLSS